MNLKSGDLPVRIHRWNLRDIGGCMSSMRGTSCCPLSICRMLAVLNTVNGRRLPQEDAFFGFLTDGKQ